MSARAAWRLESLGFADVYDYTAGKMDWLAAGLPVEGDGSGRPTAATVAHRNVPTCQLGESLPEVRERVRAAGWDVCVVVNEERIVLGLLRAKELAREDALTAEAAMRPGPSTFRPHVPIDEMAAFMISHELASAPVTTGEGELIGVLLREDAERVARELHEREGHHGG
jgi:CBS domain-containing protein